MYYVTSKTPFIVPVSIGQSVILSNGGNGGAGSWNTMIKTLRDKRLSYFYLELILFGSSFIYTQFQDRCSLLVERDQLLLNRKFFVTIQKIVQKAAVRLSQLKLLR
mmetsp:Transcript_17441/g.21478  ORF Transcript_17441/g.21478 Transcript_17441/m.21478 type:complete len:106 (+) Transcript_17441:177-494(+)